MKLKLLARVIPLLFASGTVSAQQTPAADPNDPKVQNLERVIVTGSSIKRVASEGAGAVQVITKTELQRAGITSAEQLVSTLSSNGNGLDNMVSNQGGDFLGALGGNRQANNGSAAASLRGLGAGSTLVLLNGRRMVTHGLTGGSVDLNTIPLAAIDRVEILKDGGSAIYGADAVGGVINFIMRKDYSGVEITALADLPQQSGGAIYRGNLLLGAGSLEKDSFNVFGSFTYDVQQRLRGSQRDFQNGNQPALGLSPDTVGTPFATITQRAGTALSSRFTLPGNTQSYNAVNLLALQGKCDIIPGQLAYRGDITGSNNRNQACTYDYGKQWSLQQAVDRLNFIGGGAYKLSSDHSVFVEASAARVKSSNEYTATQTTNPGNGGFYPVGGPFYQDLTGLVPGFDKTKPLNFRWRCLECGTRQQETTSDTSRFLLGFEGIIAGADYRVGASTATSKVGTKYLDGYLETSKFVAAMNTGKINPFLLPGQSQSAEAIALIEGAKFRGSLYGGESKLTQIEAVFSKEVFALPAGQVAAAVGFDFRKESFQFNDGTVNQVAVIGAGSPSSLEKASRNISAVFAELNVPILKTLSAQLAARYDRYSDFGSTVNPKMALRFQPNDAALFRGSYATGFKAPDFNDLYGGTSVGAFNSDVNDPVLCPNGGVGRGCSIRPGTLSGSNPTLVAEKSKQFSIGMVLQPVEWFSGSVDFFKVDRKDRVDSYSPQFILANSKLFPTSVFIRNAAGDLETVRAGLVNAAGDRVVGTDINLTFNFKNAVGKWTAKLDGTYLDSYKSRKSAADPWSQRVSQFGDYEFGFDLHLRWKHTASITWSDGPWTGTLSQSFSSGYKEEVDGYGSGVILQEAGFQSRVKATTLYNIAASYSGIKNLTINVGIKNVFNTKPSFSLHNVDNIAGAGWDARVGDPRLRAFTLSGTYKF